MSVPFNIFTVPEYVLQDVLQKILTFVRTDYAGAVQAGDATQSWLFKAVGGQGFQKYDYWEQAQSILCKDLDDPRYLTVNLMFNMERNGAPSIHITLPAEQTTPNGNGLGSDEDYLSNFVIEGDETTQTPGSAIPVFTRRYSAIYNIIVTSDNSNEISFLHQFLKAMLVLAIPHLHFNGIQNVALGGQDIQPYAELSNQLYMRAVTVSLQYDCSVPSMYSQFVPNDIVFKGTPIDPSTEFDQ